MPLGASCQKWRPETSGGVPPTIGPKSQRSHNTLCWNRMSLGGQLFLKFGEAGRARRGGAGEARRDTGYARRVEAKRGEAGEAKRGEARRGEAGKAKRGESRRGMGSARRVEARYGIRDGRAKRGESRRSEASRGEIRDTGSEMPETQRRGNFQSTSILRFKLSLVNSVKSVKSVYLILCILN